MNWLHAHHRSGQFDRKDQWGQVSLSPLDEIILLRMHALELKDKQSEKASSYEEMAFLLAVFSGHQGSREIFLEMFPRYAQEDDEGVVQIVPQSPEEIRNLLDEVREMNLFPDS